MTIQVNTEKLAKLIEEELPGVRGCCVTTGLCIGRIDGKQIQLVIQGDEDEFMSEEKKFVCVKKVES